MFMPLFASAWTLLPLQLSTAPLQAAADASANDVLWADYDADGHLDALVVSPRTSPTLLRATADGRFEDRSDLLAPFELTSLRDAAWGAGGADLLLVDGDGSLRLLSVTPEGSFSDTTEAAGLAGTSDVLGVSWIDFDRDERADLLLHAAAGARLFHREADGWFAPVELPSTSGVANLTLPGAAARRGNGTREPETVASETGVDGFRPDDNDLGSADLGEGDTPQTLTTPAGDPTVGGVASAGMSTVAGFVCASSLMDMNSGTCLVASSTPVLGALYPLSVDLNVDGSGNVGIGTTTPRAKLHVSVDSEGVSDFALNSDDLIVAGKDAVLGLYSSNDGNWGSALSLGEVKAGGLQNKWTIGRLTTPAGSDLRFTYGSDSNYSSNGQYLTIRQKGDVGIGTTTPTAKLEVHADGGHGVLVEGSKHYSLVVNNDDDLAAAFNGTTTIGEVVEGNIEPKIQMQRDPWTGGGLFNLFNSSGAQVATLAPDLVHAGYLLLRRSADTFHSHLRAEDGAGLLELFNDKSDVTVELHGGNNKGAGYLRLSSASGAQRILLDADKGGKGRITCDVLEIVGGADLVESFDTAEETVEPGTVMVIDERAPGRLRVADAAYDAKVAGIVSGAGGVDAGLSLGQDGVSGDTPVALTGRVYVKATTQAGPIRPGDRLTTSDLAGHAMRVTDHDRAPGTVIGKAMTALDAGEGLVLVLVNLQ